MGMADTIPALRPMSAIYTLGLGRERARNTYLSPISHSGTAYSLSGEWSRSLRRNPSLRQSYEASLGTSFLRDGSGLSAMTDLNLSLGWNMQRRFSLPAGFAASAGAGVQGEGGLLYLPRNSNNPVAARLSGFATLQGTLHWQSRIRRFPFAIEERVSLPSLGVFFSPHYGQSYYEIYLGEHSGLARLGWWGNHLRLDSHTIAELPLGNTAIRLGYRFSLLRSRASDIHTRITSHMFTLGIRTDWTSVKALRAHE